MSDSQASDNASLGTEEMRSALFAQMIMQQSSMAMMLLGKTAHPDTGKTMRDLEGAKLFIDQLEMLEFKTKGNLSPEESALLKQSLMALRMAFVESVDAPPPQSGKAPESQPKPAAGAAEAPGEEGHHPKFSKKY